MANYVTSNLGTAQAKLIGAFESGELKYTDPRTFRLFLANSAIMFPDYQQIRTREDRTILAYYKKRSSRSLGTGRSHNHTGAKGDTGSLQPSWTTYHDHFSIGLKQGDTNIFNRDEMLMNEWQNIMRNMVEGHEAVATAYLFAQRSGVNAAVVEGLFNAGTDTFEIDTDGTTTFGTFNNRAAQITKIVMDINKWGGTYDVVCDSISYAKFQAQAAQGASNATNLSFQFAGVTFIHSVGLYALAAALGYTDGYWICVPTGTIGVLPHIPVENRNGVVTTVASYGNILNPIDNTVLAVHSYEVSKDDSGANGYTQDVLTEVEASIDLAFEVSPLSTANETPLLAFAIQAST